uniref:Uncharacterized protein n=1 Tax=Cacopsylla melanoneura TaxID=428564 RepID=A0A8D9F5V4_9HEMI
MKAPASQEPSSLSLQLFSLFVIAFDLLLFVLLFVVSFPEYCCIRCRQCFSLFNVVFYTDLMPITLVPTNTSTILHSSYTCTSKLYIKVIHYTYILCTYIKHPFVSRLNIKSDTLKRI